MSRETAKRVVLSDGGGGDRWRWWEGLSPEILALIFVRIQADEMARTVPLVCRSWRDAVVGPYCWTEIDIEKWCRHVNNAAIVDPAVRKLVRRSRGTFRRLDAYCLGNSGFSFVASAGRFLSVLQIPMSEVTDEMVMKHAPSLATLTVLDISYCLKITSKSIEALGKHCKSLVQLRRNMPPPDFDASQPGGLAAKVEEEEAMAVANTMPGLEHLEFAYGRFSDRGLEAILTKCGALRHLDVRGCSNVEMEGDIEQRCELIQAFREPWEEEYEDGSDEDEDDGVLVDPETSDEESDTD